MSITTSTDEVATTEIKAPRKARRRVASLLALAAVGTAGVAFASPASAAAYGPGAPGCSSYNSVFNHRAGGGYWSVSQVNCNRQFWLEAEVKVNGNLSDDVGSGWLAGPRTAPFVMAGHELGCVHAAGYQIVDIVWFKNASGQAYQGGYFTSGAPQAFC